MKNTPSSASGNCAEMIAMNVEIFNQTPSDDSVYNQILRMKVLRSLLNFTVLENINIYNMGVYRPYSFFKKEDADCNCWCARIAIDHDGQEAPFVSIEQRRDGGWHWKRLIPIESIASVKTELLGTDETKFILHLWIKDPPDPKIPNFITF